MKLPDKIFGKNVKGQYQKFLERAKEKPKTEQPKITTNTSLDGINLKDYILDERNGIYIAKTRAHPGSNWHQAHEKLHDEKARMLIPREFIDFLLLLKSGNVKDGLGNIISGSEATSIYKEITEVRDSWRAEWLDAYFKEANGIMQINYNHRIVNGSLQPMNTENLEQCLREDCKVDLSGFNRQGMPIRTGNDFNYWNPVDGRVAGFFADSDGAFLYCCWDPGSYSWLGVRVARDKIK